MNKRMKYVLPVIMTLISAIVVVPVFVALVLVLLPVAIVFSLVLGCDFIEFYEWPFGLFCDYWRWFEVRWLCKFTCYRKWKDRKDREELLREADEAKRNAERETEEARLKEVDELAYCIPMMRLCYDKIIVDTNVFMNAVQGTDTDAKTYAVSTKFFSAIRKLGLKVHIIASQLNELSNMKREGDEKKKYKVRGAQKEIENLQNEGLLAFLGDTRARESYADPEIIKIARKLAKDGVRPLVITDDRDLRIRLGAEGITRKSLIELYEGLVETFDWKCDDQWLEERLSESIDMILEDTRGGTEDILSSLHIIGIHCGRKFVSMNNTGDKSLSANRDRADLWETFSLIVKDSSTCLLQSKANGKFVSVNMGQGGVLQARDTYANSFSEFRLILMGGDSPRFALESKAAHKYVSVCENCGNILRANANTIQDWEMFSFG